MILRNCLLVATQDKKRQVMQNVDVLLSGNKIKKIGKNIKVDTDTCVLDCKGKIVMPGLINAHTHLPMGLLRGLAEDKELHLWLKQVVARERKLSLTELKEGALLGCNESLRFGTTSVADMYEPIEATIDAAKSGIRTFLFPAFPTISMRERGKDTVRSISLPKVKENMTIGLGPHSIYSCSEKTLIKINEYAKKHGLLKMIHLAETREEQYECKKKHGLLPLQYLDNISFLDERTILVHAVWLTKEELRLIAKRKSSVVHCPASNMKLASGGVMPFKEMMAARVNVALGTDSVVSNDNLDMFEEMKFAALLHKHHYWDARIADAQTVLDMATINGAKALHRRDLGVLEEGKIADIITLNIPDYVGEVSAKNLARYLVYSASGSDVCDVIVDGKLVIEKKVLL